LKSKKIAKLETKLYKPAMPKETSIAIKALAAVWEMEVV
jgi:hypothetical protein